MTEHLDPAVVRPLLIAERNRLQRAIDELRDLAGDDAEDGSIPHRRDTDPATDTLHNEVDMGLLADFQQSLDEVDAAEARLDNGTYGTCRGCDQPIAPARLEVLPAAAACVSCAADEQQGITWRNHRA